MSAVIELTLEAFIERFQPLPHPHGASGGLDFGSGSCLLETFGDDLARVQASHPATIWTLLDGDGELYLASGIHFVNRLGYVGCQHPVPDGHAFECVLD